VTGALEAARTANRHWIEISIEIHDEFSALGEIHRIVNCILPYYLERAPTRLHPAAHGNGDVVVGDNSDDLYARVKRIRPGDYGQQGHAVEFFIQRFEEGEGQDKTDAEVGDGEGFYVVEPRQTFPIRIVG
jgi:hypothetical protein